MTCVQPAAASATPIEGTDLTPAFIALPPCCTSTSSTACFRSSEPAAPAVSERVGE